MLLALVFCLLPPPDRHQPRPAADGAEVVAVLDDRGRLEWPAPGKTEDGFVPPKVTVPPGSRVVALRVPGAAEVAPSVAVSAGGAPVAPKSIVPEPGKHASWVATLIVPKAPGSSGLTVGIAAGKWTTEGTVKLDKGAMGAGEGQGFLRIVRPEDRSINGHTQTVVVADVAMPTDTSRNAYRITLYDRSGKPLPAGPCVASPADPSSQSCVFIGRFEDTARIELQARPYVWRTYRTRTGE